VYSGQTYHWLDQLDTIVLWGVVRCRDHNADVFAVQLARPQSCNEADSGQDRVENIAAAVSCGLLRSRELVGRRMGKKRELGACIGNVGDRTPTLWFGTVTTELARCHCRATSYSLQPFRRCKRDPGAAGASERRRRWHQTL
jgi:hypothetical protein